MLHTVAKLHYEGDLSQVEVAKRLDLSTATISRLLQKARAEGIVRIEVRDLAAPEYLAKEVVRKLSLKTASIVEATGAGALASLGGPVGALLQEAGLAAGSVLAIGWGRAVRAVIEAGLPEIPGVLTVPAMGGMQQHQPHFQINEFVRLAALQLGGTPHFVHAPYLPSRASRRAYLADPVVADNVALWDRVDAAVVGIGLPHETAASGPEHHPDAAGDVMRHYFDAEGVLLDPEAGKRMIAMSAKQFRHAPLVIGVAVGEAKARAIRGAAKARLISALVTDAGTAEALLDLP
ncbi:sugar-binding transcriptional regulator [Mesorhizobium marinum]|uniref:Sugar-binding transcriptional regulator n=1 Tax=Mesorhizobium marinum TaxID=3228790 RepID=A0ABV3R2S4_9HYPH